MDESNVHDFTIDAKPSQALLEFEKKQEKEKAEFIALLKVIKSGQLKGQDLIITIDRIRDIFLVKEVEISGLRKKVIDFYMSQEAIKKIVKKFTGKDIDFDNVEK